ncbi:hypothetical protein ASE21_12425 [Flavobacterium sp. Root901]|uniref:hypothetical protein n=1 Tax=Flavobacterium sp. Root901 TaxID=1736605 RepID=UPI00070E9580|nr:hypothetical protein [Flavobacterium sp. Root901]KRD10497.1 hypothetical protein ASE21_12425 [Flavobacterium sp. Root901]
MENQYLSLDQLQVGKTYWVVNGCWEFVVKEILSSTIIIYMPDVDRNCGISKIEKCTLQIIEKK